MTSKKKSPKLRPDMNEVAFRIMQAATGEGPKPQPPGGEEKNAEAVKRGREGGKKGGKARTVSMSPRQRAALARKGAKARWSKQYGEE
jgi:hypothetical protein